MEGPPALPPPAPGTWPSGESPTHVLLCNTSYMTTLEEKNTELRAWLAGRLPADWFTGPPEVAADREELTVVGTLASPELTGSTHGAERAAAEAGRITQFREDTRDARIRIARELEHRTGRKVAWGAQCGDSRKLFTTLSVPVMTRLRQNERRVLDTLVESGVARSRSDALAWCVKLVGQHSDEWLTELREALNGVQQVRDRGPGATSDSAAPPSPTA